MEFAEHGYLERGVGAVVAEAVPRASVGAEVLAGIGLSCLLVSTPVTARRLVRVHVHQSRLQVLVFVAGSDCRAFADPVYFLIVETREL